MTLTCSPRPHRGVPLTHHLTRIVGFAGIAIIALLVTPRDTVAHSGDVITQEIQSTDNAWVLRGNFGLVTSDEPTGYVCEEAFLSSGFYRLGVLGPKRWMLWTQDAVWSTTDACSFTKVTALDTPAHAAAAHQGSGRAIWVSGGDSTTAVWTADLGETREEVNVEVSHTQWTGAWFGSADRVALSGYSTTEEESGRALIGWLDLTTKMWSPLEGVELGRWPYVLVADGEHVAGLTNLNSQLSAFWWDGQSLQTLAIEGWPTAMRFDDDGELLLAGAGLYGGIWRWRRGADALDAIVEDHSGACLARVDGSLWTCARRLREGHEVSKLNTGAASAQVALDLTSLTGPRTACGPDTDVGRVCPSVWPELERVLRISDDMGLEDMGVTQDHGTGEDMGFNDQGQTTPTTTDTSCSTTPSSPTTPWSLLIVGMCGVLTRRVRRTT